MKLGRRLSRSVRPKQKVRSNPRLHGIRVGWRVSVRRKDREDDTAVAAAAAVAAVAAVAAAVVVVAAVVAAVAAVADRPTYATSRRSTAFKCHT